jgi:hypothetical protein
MPIYHLVCIAEGDEWKTVFHTKYSLYEWMVIPFGLTNSPAMFQWFMNDVLGDLLDLCIVIYLDYILIYSDNLKEHKEHIWELKGKEHANDLGSLLLTRLEDPS